MREVPKKNYIITFVIILVTIIITLLIASAYKNQNKKTSLMYNYLSEIKSNELDSYLFENPSVIIYIADKYDIENEEKESILKSKINEFNLNNYFIYLDVNDVNKSFIDDFSSKYNYNIDINNIPILVVINDGNVVDSFNNIDEISINTIMEDIK